MDVIYRQWTDITNKGAKKNVGLAERLGTLIKTRSYYGVVE